MLGQHAFKTLQWLTIDLLGGQQHGQYAELAKLFSINCAGLSAVTGADSHSRHHTPCGYA